MLSLVHGPIAISAEDGEAFTSAALGFTPWVEGVGLVTLSEVPAYQGHFYAIQLTGKAVRFGRGSLNVIGLGWSRDDKPVLRVAGSIGSRSQLPSTAVIDPWRVDLTGQSWQPDRHLSFSGQRVSMRGLSSEYGDETGSGFVEAVFEDDIVGAGTMLPYNLEGQRNLWWCVNLETGRVHLYDAAAKLEVAGKRTSLGANIRCVGYSRKHDLFFVVRRVVDVDQLSVYANEPVAASISAPVFDPPIVKRGSTNALRSRVLGADGEPCSERNVEFTVTAGSIELAVVATDVDGWAETTFHAPLVTSVGETATATLLE